MSCYTLLGTHHVERFCLLMACWILLYTTMLLHCDSGYFSTKALNPLPLSESSFWWSSFFQPLSSSLSHLLFALFLKDILFPACSISQLAPGTCSVSLAWLLEPKPKCSSRTARLPFLIFPSLDSYTIKTLLSYCKQLGLSAAQLSKQGHNSLSKSLKIVTTPITAQVNDPPNIFL